MKEKTIEQKLVTATKTMNGLCWKFVSPGITGVPDRIILLPGGKIGFIELKAPGRQPRPIQIKRITQIRKLGIPVYVIDHPDRIYPILHQIANQP